MEKREGHIIASKAGGTAGKGAKTYKVSLPSAWLHEMELTGGDRRIELTFDGERIILVPRRTSMEPAPGHRVVRLKYYDGERLCSGLHGTAGLDGELLRRSGENCLWPECRPYLAGL